MVKKKDEELAKKLDVPIEHLNAIKKGQAIPEEIQMEVKAQENPKIGIILEGDIDSVHLLQLIKKQHKSAEFQPIQLDDDPDVSAANKYALEFFEIDAKIEKPEGSIKKVIDWCDDNNISPLYFANNYEKNMEHSKNATKTHQYFVELSAHNPNVIIADPLHVINESEIIKELAATGIEMDKLVE